MLTLNYPVMKQSTPAADLLNIAVIEALVAHNLMMLSTIQAQNRSMGHYSFGEANYPWLYFSLMQNQQTFFLFEVVPPPQDDLLCSMRLILDASEKDGLGEWGWRTDLDLDNCIKREIILLDFCRQTTEPKHEISLVIVSL